MAEVSTAPEGSREKKEPILRLIPVEKTEELLESHAAFQESHSPDEWVRKGDEFFELGVKDQDEDRLTKARQHYENGGSQVNVKKVDAKINQLAGNWDLAGRLYSEIAQELNSDNYRQEAAECFIAGGLWERAYDEHSRMSDSPMKKKNMAIDSFYRDVRKDLWGATANFYTYARTYGDLEKAHLTDLVTELGSLLEQASKSGVQSRAIAIHRQISELCEQIGKRFDDKASLSRAGEESYMAGDYVRAIQLFDSADDRRRTEYGVSQAEIELQKGNQIAIEMFHRYGKFDRVVSAYEQLKEKTLLRADLKMVADSYAAHGTKGEGNQKAKQIYADLVKRYTDDGSWSEALDCVPESTFPLGSTERYESLCRILSEIAKSSKALDEKLKTKVLIAVREVNDFELRENDDAIFPASAMGRIYDKAAGPKARADFYRTFTEKEEWARKPYIDALEDRYSELSRLKETAAAEELDRQTTDLRKVWGLRSYTRRPRLTAAPKIVETPTKGQADLQILITNTGELTANDIRLEIAVTGTNPPLMEGGGILDLESLESHQSRALTLAKSIALSEFRGWMTVTTTLRYSDSSGKEFGPVVETQAVKQMIEDLDIAAASRIVEDYKRIVTEALRAGERTEHNAGTRSSVYEELVRDFVRENTRPTLRISKGEVRDGTSGSGDCDIIIYEGEPTYVSKSGQVGIISKQAARAIIEINEKTTQISDKIKSGVYERFNKMCPKVMVIVLTGGGDSEYYRKSHDLDLYILADKDLRPRPSEFKRLISSLSQI